MKMRVLFLAIAAVLASALSAGAEVPDTPVTRGPTDERIEMGGRKPDDIGGPEPSMRIDWDCRLPHGLSYSRLPTDAERDRFFRMLKVCDSQQKLVEHCFADHGDRCEIRFKRVFLRPAALGESGDC